MKFAIIILFGVYSLTLGHPAKYNYDNHNINYNNGRHDDSHNAKILQQDYINAENGYNFVYQTSDGVTREEKAEVRNPGTKEASIVVHGSYSYIAADGNTYTVTYIADENGYQPSGQHIPALQ